MPQLDIYLFGHLEVYRNGRPVAELSHHQAGRLLGLLLINRRYPQSREALAETLWPNLDVDVAKKLLRTVLWRLRSALESEDCPGRYILAHGDSLAFHTASDYWLDVEEFEGLLKRRADESPAERADRLTKAIALYRGDLLTSIYDDWCIDERERLRRLMLAALEELMQYHIVKENCDEAIRCGELLVKHDPLQEHVHRELMELYYATGRRSDAVQQFTRCREMLQNELGLEPMPETLALYERICNGQSSAARAAFTVTEDGIAAARPTELSEQGDLLVVAQIRSRLQQVEESVAQLRDLIDQIERTTRRRHEGRKPIPRVANHDHQSRH